MEHPLSGRSSPLLKKEKGTTLAVKSTGWMCVCVCVCACMCVLLSDCVALLNLWSVACQTSLPREFSRKEYWTGQPFFSPGESSIIMSPELQEDSSPPEAPVKTLKSTVYM